MTELQISFLLSLLAFSYMNRAQPWISLSMPSLASAALLALIISDPRSPLCVRHVCLCVSPSPALLHAEKADISRGTVIEQILLPASLCHGGSWKWCWILGRNEKWEKNRVEGKGWEYLMLAYRYIWIPFCLISLFTPHFTPMTDLCVFKRHCECCVLVLVWISGRFAGIHFDIIHLSCANVSNNWKTEIVEEDSN